MNDTPTTVSLRAAELADDPRNAAVFTKDMAFWQWRDEVYAYLRSIAAALPEGEAAYTEGVCGDGAAILCDGVLMPIEEVVAGLNRYEAQSIALAQQKAEYANLEITAASCAVKLLAMEAEVARLTELVADLEDRDEAERIAHITAERDGAEASEARLRTALEQAQDHVRFLLPLAKGYVHAHPGIESTKRIIVDADEYLASGAAPADGEEENDNG